MMDQILARHNLTYGDLSCLSLEIENDVHIVCWQNLDKHYAVLGDYPELNPYEDEMWEALLKFGIDIIGYYPKARTYLVKRKAPDSVQIKATMDYTFHKDSEGKLIAVEWGNYRLTEETIEYEPYHG